MRQLRPDRGLERVMQVSRRPQAPRSDNRKVRPENRRCDAHGSDLLRRHGTRDDARGVPSAGGQGGAHVYGAPATSTRRRNRVPPNDEQAIETNETTFSLNSAFNQESKQWQQ